MVLSLPLTADVGSQHFSLSSFKLPQTLTCFIVYCPAGRQKIDGKNDCELCPQSTYRDGTKVFEKCDGCPEQKISPAPGATSVENCTLYRCNEGEQPNNSSSGCEPCPRGTYQPASDQPKCLACPSGTSTPHTGAVTNISCQVYCPSGSEKNGQGQCVECYIGYYKDNTIDVFSNCTRCSNQSYVTSGNASISNQNCTVLNCLEGYKSNYTSHSCVPCPKGTYQDKKYQNSCIECPLNHSTRFTNSTKFSDCETYCPSGQEKVNGTCVPCQQGLYKDNDQDLFMSCDLCPPELITPSTASTSKQNCTLGNCSAGYYINGTGCSPCPKGQYQELRWQYNCSQCPPNRDTESIAASSLSHCLLNCSAGYENKNGSDICSQCDVGHYKDAPGATTCKPCAPDLGANNITISPSPGATDKKNCSKLVCVAGYYPSEGKTCLPCSYGTYQPTRWQDQCLHCDGGYTTYTLGSIHKEDCQLNCSVGQGLYNGTCRNCSIGFYNDKQDPSVRDCKQCPPSFITETEGATSVSMCTIVNCDKLGQYRDVATNTCVDCPVGTFQDLIRQTSCKTCPGGTTTQFTGSVSQTDCKKDCPAGQQLNEALNICQPCERGFYRPKSSWTCLPCGTDLTTPNPGATSQADCHVPTCVAGKFYSDASKSCLECPLHSYQDLAGQRDCKPCPDNTVTASTGTTSLTGCQAPCDIGSGTKCSVSSEACVNDLSVSDGYRCDCKPEYTNISNKCIHKCDTDFCGPKGVCRRSPFKCECVEGYSGPQCNIRPDAAALSDKENQTILIAVITTLGGILFIILIIVCICVMSRRRRPSQKTPYTSDLDERASIATRSMKGFEDYPTFAVNPAFSSKAPSMLNSPMMALPSQSGKTYYNPTFNGDEDNDPAVYRA
ncbi:proprotein convertase subtilisin/kexin type 5-like [Physella acuta]|uniref:proprotein convertase subtilisin/kexin type 5-like n=1 Tax=Physella acuta TaxID=109671 RepID=UPI0027DB7D9B|nr:proprotein convertase subtilisin/kexin type 5-like [Physella acuta]